jgi:hypothetical protein
MELILIKFRILIKTFHNGGFLEWYRRQNGDMSVNLMMKECVVVAYSQPLHYVIGKMHC